MTTTWLCQCNSSDCALRVQLELNVAQQLQQNNEVVIVDGCENGPSEGDDLVEKREGYSVYKPAN